MAHPKAKHQVCELCCIRKYQVLSPIGTCDDCTEALRKDHELQFLKNRVLSMEKDLAEHTENVFKEGFAAGIERTRYEAYPNEVAAWFESNAKKLLDPPAPTE